jgi:hypothetical protein
VILIGGVEMRDDELCAKVISTVVSIGAEKHRFRRRAETEIGQQEQE